MYVQRPVVVTVDTVCCYAVFCISRENARQQLDTNARSILSFGEGK